MITLLLFVVLSLGFDTFVCLALITITGVYLSFPLVVVVTLTHTALLSPFSETVHNKFLLTNLICN